MKIYYSKTFEKKFAKYSKNLQIKIYKCIKELPEGDVKRLKGDHTPPIHRARISKYRILFHMDDEVIWMLKVDSRGDIYKKPS